LLNKKDIVLLNMARILVLFAHPALEKSRVHKAMLEKASGLNGVTINDLYQWYPDLDIDVEREQGLLLQHDIIVWQHPFYWYSSPAIIKQWQDLVLEHGWAYGSNGIKLQGKKAFNAISAGGSALAYSASGRNRFTIRQLLAPFEQTAYLCHMQYLPPFVVHETHRLKEAHVEAYAQQYAQILSDLAQDAYDLAALQASSYLNDFTANPHQKTL
jgi:glutathione-regulated potassium-efflux system ancillary protein KefG